LALVWVAACVSEPTPERGDIRPLLDHASERVGPYPADFYTAPDENSVTGLRVDFSRAVTDAAPLRALFFDAGDFKPHRELLESLDGFSGFAPVLIPFSGPIAPDTLANALHLVDVSLGVTVPVRIEYLPDSGNAWAVMRPRKVLYATHRHAVLITDSLRDASGLRLKPQPASGLAGVELTTALDAAGVEKGDILGAFAFTVQNSTGEVLAVAADIAARPAPVPYDIVQVDARTIRGKFRAADYRRNGTIPAAAFPAAVTENAIEFYLRLPRNHTTAVKPFPLAIWGHGLTGTRTSIPEVDDAAVIAIDAVEHGTRQTIAHRDLVAFKFFDFFHLLVTRDNLRQTQLDNIALSRMVTVLDQELQNAGIGSLLDGQRIGYLGGSLGAIVGGVAAPLSPNVESMVMVVGGAGLSQAFRHGLFGLLAPNAVHFHTAIEREFFFGHIQALFDRADPVNYLRFAVHEPLAGHTPRNMLFGYVIGDRLVPNSTNETYLWAAGLSLFGPIFQNSYGVPVLDGDSTSANVTLQGLPRTAVAYQYNPPEDEVRGLDRHGYMADNESARLQIEHFFLTGLRDGAAELIHAR
jgi:hypothetical protein